MLDYGCGWGGETLWMARRVRSACGVDVDGKAIAAGAQRPGRIRRQELPLRAVDDGRLPFPDASFDAVMSTDTFEHVMDLAARVPRDREGAAAGRFAADTIRPAVSFAARRPPLLGLPVAVRAPALRHRRDRRSSSLSAAAVPLGLVAGIVVSLGYMTGAAILTPDLWIEPLGALVKTGPAIVLMLVALLTLDNR